MSVVWNHYWTRSYHSIKEAQPVRVMLLESDGYGFYRDAELKFGKWYVHLDGGRIAKVPFEGESYRGYKVVGWRLMEDSDEEDLQTLKEIRENRLEHRKRLKDAEEARAARLAREAREEQRRDRAERAALEHRIVYVTPAPKRRGVLDEIYSDFESNFDRAYSLGISEEEYWESIEYRDRLITARREY